MANKVLYDTLGRPIMHHGDIADALFAMSDAAMQLEDVKMARLLDAGACEFQKKYDIWMKDAGHDKS